MLLSFSNARLYFNVSCSNLVRRGIRHDTVYCV
jgi:hypothetical protein